MLFWICLTGPLLFIAVSLILGDLAPKYAHLRDEMSYLVYSPYGKWQTLNFLGCGVLTLGLAVMISGYQSELFVGTSLIKAGAWVLGASLVLLRVFPTEKKGHKTYVSRVHMLVFVVSVLLQGTLQLLFAVRNPHTIVYPYFIVSGIVTLAGLPAMIIWNSLSGLYQRVLVTAIMMWVTIGALLIR